MEKEYQEKIDSLKLEVEKLEALLNAKSGKITSMNDVDRILNTNSLDKTGLYDVLVEDVERLSNFAELLKIVRAYNKGKERLNWKNSKQKKFYLWGYWNGTSWSVLCGSSFCFGYLYCPAALHFVNSEDAWEAYKNFPEVFIKFWEAGSN